MVAGEESLQTLECAYAKQEDRRFLEECCLLLFFSFPTFSLISFFLHLLFWIRFHSTLSLSDLWAFFLWSRLFSSSFFTIYSYKIKNLPHFPPFPSSFSSKPCRCSFSLHILCLFIALLSAFLVLPFCSRIITPTINKGYYFFTVKMLLRLWT